MSLRVISGTARGRKLKPVPGNLTRPVMDRVKEALFNILAGDVVYSNWWDLYAGTGGIGIEALSRGAEFVRFTDLQRTSIETIKWNVEHCGFQMQSEIRRGDALTLVDQQPDRQFEYIYIAPPQYRELWSATLTNLDGRPGWLSEDGWAILQIDPKEYYPPALQAFEIFDERKYGNTLLLFYRKIIA